MTQADHAGQFACNQRWHMYYIIGLDQGCIAAFTEAETAVFHMNDLAQNLGISGLRVEYSPQHYWNRSLSCS